MTNKREFLRELLIGIYNTERIKYNDKRIYIDSSSLFKQCQFDKTQKYYNYSTLIQECFRLTFLDSKTEFWIDTKGGSCKKDNPKKNQIPFKRTDAVLNAINFLKKQGVDFSVLSNEDITKVESIERIIFSSLCIVNNFIFNTVEYDIEKEFSNMINRINLYLCKESFSVSAPQHTTEENSVVEGNLSKKECNRYVCVRSEDVGIPGIVSFTPISANFYIINRKEHPKDNSNDIISPYWLMAGLGVYDPMMDEVIEISSYSTPSVWDREYDIIEYPETFSISDIYPDANFAKSFKCYYLCNVTPDKVRAIYPEASDPYTLRKMIIAKDKERITSKFKYIMSSYYEEVIRYIEDVLDRIIAMDLEGLITGDIGADILSAFNIDYDKVISFLKENGVMKNRDSYLYLMIDRAIGGFIIQINIDTDQLVNMICLNVNAERIEMHIKKLKEFASSDKISSAIIIQEEDQKKNPDNYYTSIGTSAMSYGNVELYTKRVKGRFSSLKCTIEKYASFLSEALNNIDVSKCP